MADILSAIQSCKVDSNQKVAMAVDFPFPLGHHLSLFDSNLGDFGPHESAVSCFEVRDLEGFTGH